MFNFVNSRAVEKQFKITYFVYLVSDELRKKIRVGITVNLKDRLEELSKSNIEACIYLVYYESFNDAKDAVKREMKFSSSSQRRLWQLIGKTNPDLSFLNDVYNKQLLY